MVSWGLSSRRKGLKKDIEPMDQASEAILARKPVRFHYKQDNTTSPQFGLIAEQVANVNPDLVARDNKSQIYTVRYDAVNAMLLNEFLKEHRKVQEMEKAPGVVTAQLKEQAAQIQKVSARLEVDKPLADLVANRP
jgi:Chaperone of endosialidase